MRTATVISQPDGQIVHLPSDIHIDGPEVFVRQVGDSVVLVPKHANSWQPLLDSLNQFTDDFMDERFQPDVQQREPIF
jgi:antitoxin VapB